MTDGPGKVTILSSRYGGIYEPGRWIAFACWPGEIPPDWNADDMTCAEFFANRRGEIGGGATPEDAYADLLRLLDERRHSLGSLPGAIISGATIGQHGDSEIRERNDRFCAAIWEKILP
jgi:hypothetical protein